MAHANDIIRGTRLLQQRILVARLHCLAIHVHACAQQASIEVGKQGTIARPNLYLAFLQRQELLLLVQEDEGLWWRELWSFARCTILTIYDPKWVPSRLEHDPFIKLLQEFDLAPSLIEADLHQDLACVHIYESHGHAVSLDHVEQEHHAVADLELCNLVILKNILKLVGLQRPDSVGVLEGVLRDDLRVQLVKLDEIRIA